MCQVAVQICLHLPHLLIPEGPPLDTEVFIEQGSMQPLDKAVALRLVYLDGSELNPLQFQGQLVGMMVRMPTEPTFVIRQNGVDSRLVGFEARQHRFIEHMD